MIVQRYQERTILVKDMEKIKREMEEAVIIRVIRSLKRSLKRRTIIKSSKLKQLFTKVSVLTLAGITIARLLISLQLVILVVQQIPKKLSITLKKKNLN
jgi:hypothetical protein